MEEPPGGNVKAKYKDVEAQIIIQGIVAPSTLTPKRKKIAFSLLAFGV